MIFFEFAWTPAEMAQAEDRINRIGQESHCNYYYFVGKDSIDEHFVKMLAGKKSVMDSTTDGDYEFLYDLIEKEALKF